MKKFISCFLAVTMLAASSAALAAAPSAYDGKSYESLGYRSSDPDGVFNLAVIANGDVEFYCNAMYIEGSIYSNGKIYSGNGQENKIDGLFISGTGDTVYSSDDNNNEWTQRRTAKGYVHVNNNGTTEGINYYSTQPEYAGNVYDTETSFDYQYEEFEIPDAGASWGDAEFNIYGNETARNLPATIRENAKYDAVTMNGSYGPALTIDTTDGDIDLVIDEITAASANINIKVVGDNQANIYIGSIPENIPLIINYDNTVWPAQKSGSAENTHLYLGGDKVAIRASRIAVADIHVNTPYLEISGDANVEGDVFSGAEEFVLAGGQTEIKGSIFVPNAHSKVIGSSTQYGQLYTDKLTINGAAKILWAKDTAAEKSDEMPEATPEATDLPAEPTQTPAPLPDGDEVDLKGASYAYIFGYEPEIEYVVKTDEDGNYISGGLEAKVKMAPDDAVTREQVAAMIMRMVDQKYDTMNAQYPVTSNIAAHAGTWYERGLAYLAEKGTFDGIDAVETGAVTRGEVAKLVAFGLNLSQTTDVAFTDIDGNEYAEYIKMMVAANYMDGMSATEFAPNKVMTRAEFCQMFNNIIDRNSMGLAAKDGTVVTPEIYSIVDISGHWAEDVMLKATSVYDEDGYVDIETRLANIRNVLDNYDSQKWY